MNSRTVLLYGQSLLLSGVAASLAECPGLHVARAATWAEAGQRLAEGVPDVLIFDLTDANESHILPLLLKNPGLLLIGLDTECNQRRSRPATCRPLPRHWTNGWSRRSGQLLCRGTARAGGMRGGG